LTTISAKNGTARQADLTLDLKGNCHEIVEDTILRDDYYFRFGCFPLAR